MQPTPLIGVLVVVTLGCLQTTCSQNTYSCSTNYWGANCTECHCLNGAAVCDADTGICTDYQCDRGWTDTPYCQTDCSTNTWGINCANECHCSPGDVCDRINGVCNRSCDVEWSGPSCQTRLTRLTEAPTVTNITCEHFYVRWRAWSLDLDTGDAPVGSYSVQQSLNSSAWAELIIVPILEQNQLDFHFQLANANPYTYYSFRIVANRLEYGKPVEGLPGPASTALRPLELCIAPVESTTELELTTEAITTETMTTTVTETTSTPDTTTIIMTTTTTMMTTTPKPNPPGAVRQLSVRVDDLSGHLSLTWAEPSNMTVPLLRHNLTYQVIGIGDCNDSYTEDPISVALSAHRTAYEVTDLTPWRTYQVTLVAINVAGGGSVAREVFASADRSPTGMVKGVVVSNVDSRSATFEWDALECNERGGELVYYQVLVWRQEGINQITQANVDVRTGRSHTINGLVPFTQYGMRVRYVNSVQAGPYSEDLYITTAEDVPPAPTGVSISEKTDTSLLLSWNPPSPTYGVIVQYKIIFTSARDPQVENSIVQDAEDVGNSRNISKLQPFTEYHFQVQARTQANVNDGWGNKSVTVNAVTADGLPESPRNLQMDTRNASCILLEWEAPEILNGILTSYRMQYQAVVIQSSYSATAKVTRILGPSTLVYQACLLLPAAQYRFRLAAGTSKGYGPEAFVNLWTEVGQPDNPPRPVIASVGDTSITIRIQPVVLSTGPVSGYFIVVEAIEITSRRRKRALPNPVAVIGLQGYTTAELSRDDVKVARDFIVGDQQTYGAYINSKLQKKTDYNIYYIVASSLDGVTKMAFSQIVSPVQTGQKFNTLPTLASTATPSPQPTEEVTTQGLANQDDTTLIVVASVVSLIVLIILIVLIVLLIWCWKRRGHQKMPSGGHTDAKNETWLQYYTKHFYNTPLQDKGKWSNTVDLNESRYPTMNDKCAPMDLQVSDMHHNRPCISFEAEYKNLPSGLKFPYTEAQKPANSERNRFDHILPYDHSRVILRDTANSYINANYIDSYAMHHSYIAVQSPFNEVTMCDFWYMIYQEKATHIVFLARLVEDGIVKSEIYWPEKGSQLHGVISVQHIKTDVFANFIVRTFELHIGGTGARKVRQYQYTSWPDHGVPEDPIPFLEFLQKVRRNVPQSKHPLVVHCGTGVSRTAVFITVDSLLEQAKTENAVNVYRFCCKMRRNRTMMVRTLKQYVLIYDILFEALITKHNVVGRDLKTSYRILSDTNPKSDKSYFREQFEVLERYIPDPKPTDYCVAMRSDNVPKNRFNTLRLLPSDKYRTPIQNPATFAQKEYINGLFMDSYLTKNTFIVAQTPMKSTVTDFWRMIYDYNVKTVAMINGPDFLEDTCASYWPDRIGIQKWQQFFVNLVSEKDSEYMTIRHLELASDKHPTKPARTIMHFQFKAWKMYDKVPWSREAMISFVNQVEKWQKAGTAQGPIVVHCMDGASQSGLFCACYVMSEKLHVESQVDIFHTIKHLKMRRSHMINSLEQYKFCYKFLWDAMHLGVQNGNAPVAPNGRMNHAFMMDDSFA